MTRLLHRQFLGILVASFLLPLLPATTQAQVTACERTVVVRPGDTLSGLAEDYLGSAAAYPRIVAATNSAARTDDAYTPVDDVRFVQVGWRLCIPAPGVNTSEVAEDAPAATPTPNSNANNSDGGEPDEPAADVSDEVLLATPNPAIAGGAHPLSLEYLQRIAYPAQELVFEQELEPGANYYRYLVSYLSEGNRIYAYMTVPDGEKPATGWPVIIFNHGYIPPEQYRSTERYIAYVDGFARNGYIVFRSDYRGHGFSEGEARGGYGFPDYTVDVLNGVAAMRAYPDADPARFGMWGHSMGGFVTLRAMVTNDWIKAGVIWAGVVASYPDLINNWTRPATDIPARARRWRVALQEEYGTPEENPAFWASLSANTYLDDISGPLQIHHGDNDVTVPIQFSETLYDQMLQARQPVEYYSYPGDDHNLSIGFSTAMRRSLAYFDEYVK